MSPGLYSSSTPTLGLSKEREVKLSLESAMLFAMTAVLSGIGQMRFDVVSICLRLNLNGRKRPSAKRGVLFLDKIRQMKK
jgi:hypothetical protein